MTIRDWLAQHSEIEDRLVFELVFKIVKPTTSLDAASWTMSHDDYALNTSQLSCLDQQMRRLRQGEPAAYVLGEIKYHSLNFKISQAVLIPRPETAELIELAITFIKNIKAPFPRIIDVGTGSGVIALSIADWAKQHHQSLSIYALDISAQALTVAKHNAQINQLVIDNPAKLYFEKSNLLDSFQGTADLIVANLPYIPSDQIDHLNESVVKWEPRIALDGGADGLRLINRLLETGTQTIRPEGQLMIEIWHNHHLKQLPGPGLYDYKLLQDQYGEPRFVIAKPLITTSAL